MEKQELLTLTKLGYSQREISKKLNASQTTIRYWLKKYNIKTINGQYNKKEYSEKLCPICKTIKPIDDFYNRTGRKTKAGYCKKCSNQYHQKRVQKVKIRMILYKGGECVDCHLKIENSHYNVFDFHHLDPSTKDLNFVKIKYQKWNKIKKEIDKCILLCSNCHRLRHAEKMIID